MRKQTRGVRRDQQHSLAIAPATQPGGPSVGRRGAADRRNRASDRRPAAGACPCHAARLRAPGRQAM
ncbi:unnamed protein product [Lampetra fluviatilis]